ncbi:ribonuclease H-like domain-containing protein [Tanacetum coccineum]
MKDRLILHRSFIFLMNFSAFPSSSIRKSSISQDEMDLVFDDLIPPGIDDDDDSEGDILFVEPVATMENNIEELNEDESFDPGGVHYCSSPSADTLVTRYCSGAAGPTHESMNIVALLVGVKMTNIPLDPAISLDEDWKGRNCPSHLEAINGARSSCLKELEFSEDANLKLLRSLPLAWKNIVVIMRNKPDLDTMSMDDLYKNLKVYEAEIKSQSSSSSSSNSQNMAFISSENTSSTNEAVNTAHQVSTANSHGQASSSSYANDVIFSFFISQSKSPLLDNKDMEQIDSDDLKEIDLKWQVAMLIIRIKRFINKTRRNLNLNGKEAVGLDMTKVECYNCHRKGHFARDCRALRNQGNRNGDNARRVLPVETSANALVVQDGIGSSRSSSSDSKVSTYSKACLKSYESLKEHFDKQKEQLKKSNLEIIVPPPFTGNFKIARADLYFAGLDDSMYMSKVSETITSVPNAETTVTKTSKDSLEKPKTIRFSAPIIKDWEFDSEDENVFEPKEVKKTVKSSFEKIEFVNARNSIVEKPRKFSQNPRDNKRNRNSFEFTKKACFVCGSFKHLIKDCDFHDKKMVQKPVLNKVKRGTGQREVRKVWNNEMTVNHQNFSNSRRDFDPTAVLTKSGIVPISAARQSSSRAAAPASVAKPINTVAPKPFVNVARPRPNAFHKSHSPSRTPFNQQTTLKNKILKVNTAKVNYVNTAKGLVIWCLHPHAQDLKLLTIHPQHFLLT